MAYPLEFKTIARLRQLVSEKCEGTLTEDGIQELSELLDSSAEARDEYWKLTLVHANLGWHFAGQARCEDELGRILLDTSAWEQPEHLNSRRTHAYAWAIAIAASLLIAGFGGQFLAAPNEVPPAASVSAEADAVSVLGRLMARGPQSRWSLGRPGNHDIDAVRQGDTLWLEDGEAELHLLSDTVAKLQAPVILQVVSLDRLRLLRGRIEVDVAKGAEGFVVETTSAEVVDLGTVFSVEVTHDGTDLVVFDGVVDLKVSKAPTENQDYSEASASRFRTGEAVSVSSDGTLSRLVNVSRVLPHSQPVAEPVIASVVDNNEREGLWSFYEVVASGMIEDARAFVDRRYEWNGATEAGMPSYLLGADYVKTFNNDKVTPDLTMELTLNQPARVYVLLDKRITPPAWLVRDFSDTGDVIGIDEAWHDPLDHKPGLEDFAGVGPGMSIERTHSIWMQDVPKGGVVTLGPNGRLPGQKYRDISAGANMYGIAATPLETEL
ncbi:FecR protein [Botrimarina colliarenosi]|uniref:FecR protein n=1 Tax=Botrimarina colliarenosi TaxID=2528001 RepID=A0A5C5ZX61_9BACT|nr:FecR domain-containing protein [Botrimarina colliarenosi]TWT91725.1 FecR protein [Botrimarina colliarenosi]